MLSIASAHGFTFGRSAPMRDAVDERSEGGPVWWLEVRTRVEGFLVGGCRGRLQPALMDAETGYADGYLRSPGASAAQKFGGAALMSASAERSRSTARSPSETIPIGSPFSTTGIRRTAFSRMSRTALSVLSVGDRAVRSVLQIWPTWTPDGLRSSATARPRCPDRSQRLAGRRSRRPGHRRYQRHASAAPPR